MKTLRAIRFLFIGPLGMSHSSYVWQESFESTAAAGHDRHGRSRPQYKQDANAAASLYTTASDYARFVAARAGKRKPEAQGRVDGRSGHSKRRSEGNR
ncbi:MAG TPA: serine hydrolase [Acidobacteriota bacterium]|nr:serine hydrolase [Acidobacteriota bacterium]